LHPRVILHVLEHWRPVWCVVSAAASFSTKIQLFSERRVLVVEDDCLIASMMSDELNEYGYVVIGPAGNLADAMVLASTSALDAALVDLTLGQQSAVAIAQVLADRRIPYMFMTGDDSPEGKFHHVPVLRKPFTTTELQRALHCMMSG
jgi:DNA-binding response OmpR family regulator